MLEIDSKLMSIYKNKKVFITGHTGFKGSWLCFYLKKIGADVCGYSIGHVKGWEGQRSHFEELNLDVNSYFSDIRDYEALKNAICEFKPDIIFHLAAQPLVLNSYENPRETFEVNSMGTVNLFEAARKCDSVKAVVNITTDKVYKDNKSNKPYKETDPIGASDPYSTSKACSELISESYRDHIKVNYLIATARAGNTFGYGDWSNDRLFPDIVKACKTGSTLEIRNPKAIRPWQHILDVVKGYLSLGKHLLDKNFEYEGAWNFGPGAEVKLSVEEILSYFNINYKVITKEVNESEFLLLDTSKSEKLLNIDRKMSMDESIGIFINESFPES